MKVFLRDISMRGGLNLNNLRSSHSPLRFRWIFLAASLCGGSLILLCFHGVSDVLFLRHVVPAWAPQRYKFEFIDAGDGFTINTEGCTIPYMNPFDESIKKFVEVPINAKPCKNANRSLLANNETHIWVVRHNFKHYNLEYDSEISCCYKAFYRPSSVSDIAAFDVDDRVTYNDCIYFLSDIEVLNEFVIVTCEYESKFVFEQLFLFAPKKRRKDDFHEVPKNKSYNVIVIGIDGISRMNFHRTMPKTLAYLKSKGAIELLGYNKVGDNTFPNLSPMLLGVKDTELKKTCWPNILSTFDNCPFVWEWYKDAGFYTAFGEDSASLGTFNFEKYGFSRTPTDYYLHTFMHEAEARLGNNKDFNCFLCMGDKYFYQVLLDYITNLTATLKSSKLFGFFWEVSMSHDYLNYPMLMDNSFEKFFKNLNDTRYLDETVLILLSDHGIRWGNIRYTRQGRLEERLPLVYVLLPPSFRQNYNLAYDNIKMNAKRLTTPFDIHETLSDLVNLESISNENIKQRSGLAYANQRSISLFLKIPSNRTCLSAGIEEHWCTCASGVNVGVGDSIALAAGRFMVDALNDLLRGQAACAELHLSQIVQATELVAVANSERTREFQMIVRTNPGGGVFEGTIIRHNGTWSLAGTVSRLNIYGNQSRCVHHYHLKLYCYCH